MIRKAALAVLATIHVLGVLGAPFAAKLHVFQPGATRHQDFHVVWEACKYLTASLLSLFVVLGPLRRGERGAWAVMLASSIAMFGGVFFADALTGGAPPIDHWAYGSFLVLSLAALAALAALRPATALRPAPAPSPVTPSPLLDEERPASGRRLPTEAGRWGG